MDQGSYFVHARMNQKDDAAVSLEDLKRGMMKKVNEVCGAFVTLEHTEGRDKLLQVLKGGYSWFAQPNYVRFPEVVPKEASVAT